MSEDISSYIRSAITLALLSALVGTGASILSIMMLGVDGLSNRFVSSVNAASTDLIKSVEVEDSVSAPFAYKFIHTNGLPINSVRIELLDGTVYSDASVLLSISQSNVAVGWNEVDGMYDYTIVEVNR